MGYDPSFDREAEYGESRFARAWEGVVEWCSGWGIILLVVSALIGSCVGLMKLNDHFDKPTRYAEESEKLGKSSLGCDVAKVYHIGGTCQRKWYQAIGCGKQVYMHCSHSGAFFGMGGGTHCYLDSDIMPASVQIRPQKVKCGKACWTYKYTSVPGYD